MEILTSTILFLLAVVLFFYLPGKFLNGLSRIKLNLLEDLVFSTILGMLFFTIVSLVLSYLKSEIFIIPIFIFISIFEIVKKPWSGIKFTRMEFFPIVFISISSIIFAVPMITSGYVGDNLRLIGVNAYDGLWYLSLINEMRVNFPPQHPGFAGVPLYGYHFLLFFLMAKIGNIINVSTVTLMLKLFPVLVALLWGFGVYVFMKAWSNNRITSLVAVFLSMFGGSFVFMTWLEGHRSLSLDSGYGMLQPGTSLVNPTFALSIVFMIAFMFSVLKYINTNSKGWLVLITLVVGLTPLFKVYGGILIMGGFILFVMYELVRMRCYILLSVFGAAVLFFSTYWRFGKSDESLFFLPLWAPHNVLRDNMPWYGYDEKISTYSKQGVIRGLVKTEFYALYIYIIGNLGSRTIGLFLGLLKFLRNRKKPSLFLLLILAMTLASIILPLFFAQTVKVYETTQFAWYFLFLTSLLSAFGFGYLLSLRYKLFFKVVVSLAVLLITLPSAVYGLSIYTNLEKGLVDKTLYKSLSFLKNRGKYTDTVLILPYKKNKVNLSALQREYIIGTPVIPALANKRSFFSYEYFKFKGLNTEERFDFISSFLALERSFDVGSSEIEGLVSEIEQKLAAYNIVYIYSQYQLKLDTEVDFVENIYSDAGAYIYEVK